MTRARWLALPAPAAFVVLAGTLAALGTVPPGEAACAAVSILLGFLPAGWLDPAGWRRRAAELALLPAAYALVMVGDPTLRRMVLPPLLLLAAWAAAGAATRRLTPAAAGWLLAALALAARAATGLGLAGEPPARAVLAVVAAGAVGWASARALGPRAGMLAAPLGALLPLQHWPLAALGAVAGAIALARLAPPGGWRWPRLRGWVPAAAAVALVSSTLAPWGGMAPGRAFPAAGWPAAGAAVLGLALTPLLAPPLAGAAWLGVAACLGPAQPAPPDRAGVVLSAAAPRAELPMTEGGRYLLETSLANAATVPAGTVAATVRVGAVRRSVRVGRETAEWAHEREDVRARVAHPLPDTPVWRPGGLGAHALWGVAGRMEGVIPAGVTPSIERDPALPPDVDVAVATAGTSRPTPPRDWPLAGWIVAAAVVVALLQLAGGTWRGGTAPLPWAVLLAFALAARMPVEPLGLLAERHAVDAALLAVLAAFLPAARGWLARRRVFLTAAALLVPLALATPHLTPPLYGDEPFHLIVLDSLVHDRDLDLANNYHLERWPYNRIYLSGNIFLHSPALAALLVPGYAVAGRSGALALLALAGAGVVALLARRAGALGCPPARVGILVTAMLLTFPLATFSTQVWPEVPGALAAAAAVVLLGQPRRHRGVVAGLLAIAAAVKTRLGLVMFPLAAVAWRPRRLSGRELRRAALVLASAAAAGLAVSWATLGHPLGFRSLSSLLPRDPRVAVAALGGLLIDPAGGLLFTAPLLLLALAGVVALARRGGDGERALLFGAAATVLALLHSHEWYGGGSPPARYLVPLLPVFVLSAAMLLRGAPPWRAAAWLAVPPSLLAWWVLLTRPQLSVNPGDGGWWLADALARRFGADARHLLPSFLRPSPATLLVPLLLVAALGPLAWLAWRRPGFARTLGRLTPALWLLGGASLAVGLVERYDRVVELEDPQVTHHGGTLEPPAGTFSRFLFPNGWRVGDGDGVEVPLHLATGVRVRLQGWLEGETGAPMALLAGWDELPPRAWPLAGSGRGEVELAPVAPGRHRLRLSLRAPQGGRVVLDRLLVTP